jgi:nucleotide-binding universal stress UspA family protein
MLAHRLSAPVPLLAIAALSATALLASCGRFAPPPRAVVALDEAFSAARPGLAARLQDGSLFGEGPAGMMRRPLLVPVSMSEGAGKALDEVAAERKRSGAPIVLVASPLIARTIAGNGTWAGDPPILVPEWPGETPPKRVTPGLWTASSDPVPAYRAAGEAAGAFVAALSAGGGSPSCGILFSEAPSRPRAALVAFAAAYAETSEGRPLFARELAGEAAPGDRQPQKPGETAVSEVGAAQAATAELLGSDIRVLFVALGSASGAAIKAAERPGLAIGADFPAPEPPAALAFRILPDDKGIAGALASRFWAFRDSRPEPGQAPGGAVTVPAVLLAGPAAGEIRIGRLDFAFFLKKASKRALR